MEDLNLSLTGCIIRAREGRQAFELTGRFATVGSDLYGAGIQAGHTRCGVRLASALGSSRAFPVLPAQFELVNRF